MLHASANESTLLLAWFGVFGLIGSVVLGRLIDRADAPVAATAMVVLMAVSFLAWPFAAGSVGIALALVPWGLGCFSANSAQQAGLSAAAPALAPALLALNTSAIYLKQAAGASSGGWLIAHRGYGVLSEAGLAWLIVAVAASGGAIHAARP